MTENQDSKKSSRGAWTLKELMQPISWGDFFGIVLWGVHILGYVLIVMFVVDIVKFYIFHIGTIIWSRELFALPLALLFIVGTNYYVIRKKKHA